MIKYFFYAFILILILSLLTAFLDKNKKYNDLLGKVESYRQLTDHVAELEIKYQSQVDLNKQIKENWESEKKSLYNKVKIVEKADFVLQNKRRETDSADLILIKDGKQKYLFHELHFVSDDGKEGPPIGYVMIFEDGHVISKLYKNRLEVNSIATQDSKSGRYKVLSKAQFILEQSGLANRSDSKKKDWKNVPYDLNIVGGVAYVDPTENNESSRFRFWDPHFDLGLNNSITLAGKYEFNPNVGASIFSFGPSKQYNKLRFFRVGIGGSKDSGFQGSFSPIMYNLGNLVKFISNTYVYPTISTSEKFGMSIGIGTSLSF